MSLIFNAALDSYAKTTGIDLTEHPSCLKLQQCESTDAIIGHFQERVMIFKEHRDGYRKLITVLKTIVQVLISISGVLGETITVGLHHFESQADHDILPCL
jgi:hypothetical protein